MEAEADTGGEPFLVNVRNERLLVRMDELRWDKPGASPHEKYRRERMHRKLVRKALAKKLIEP